TRPLPSGPTYSQPSAARSLSFSVAALSLSPKETALNSCLGGSAFSCPLVSETDSSGTSSAAAEATTTVANRFVPMSLPPLVAWCSRVADNRLPNPFPGSVKRAAGGATVPPLLVNPQPGPGPLTALSPAGRRGPISAGPRRPTPCG